MGSGRSRLRARGFTHAVSAPQSHAELGAGRVCNAAARRARSNCRAAGTDRIRIRIDAAEGIPNSVSLQRSDASLEQRLEAAGYGGEARIADRGDDHADWHLPNRHVI
jgi:hypothetical protein